MQQDYIKESIQQIFDKYSISFEDFAKDFLKIKTKDGQIIPFILNETQKIILKQVREQYKRKGNLRLVIVKGRQQGCTTLFAAYYLWRALFLKGQEVFILSYLQKSSSEILDKVNFFYNNLPDFLKLMWSKIPDKGKGLRLNNGSIYSIASAEGKEIRGGTYQMLHLSESSFYSFDSIVSLMQTVSNEKTMIVFESTPKGIDNAFYHYYKMSNSNDSDYEAIFVPWWKELGYQKKDIQNYKPSKEAIDYANNYNPNLSINQLKWLEDKISEIGVDVFNCEYPATPELAFLQNLDNALIPVEVINKAVNYDGYLQEPRSHYIIIGVDVARFGSDVSCICIRHGKNVLDIQTFEQMDTNTFSQKVRKVILDYIDYARTIGTELHKVYIDTIGIGAGVYDNLASYSDVSYYIKEANSAAKSINPEAFINKRAESYFRLKEFLETNNVKLPNNQNLIKELSNIRYEYSQGDKRKIWSKDKMKEHGFHSPDMADSLMFTFFEIEPVKYVDNINNFQNYGSFSNNDIIEDSNNRFLWGS